MTTITPVSLTSEAVAVQEQHRFDEARLTQYMGEQLSDFTPPLQVAQIHGGMSNPTFILTDGNARRYVLRKKPPGVLLPSAHAVDREFRVQSALRGTGVPIATMRTLCEDPAVIGTAFYIMDFIEGRILRTCTLPDMQPDERHAIYIQMIDVLATLHQVDFRTVGLEDYGRVGAYMERQVSRWSKQYVASKTDELLAMEKLMAWLPEHLPKDDETTISHGDFRLENMILHPHEPRILAVLDWELSTLGAPLADLSYNCLPYYAPDPERGDLMNLDYASYGIPSLEEYIGRYSAQTGRGDIPQWLFYVVFSLFRLAAICQGVYKRGLEGNAASPTAISRGKRGRDLAIIAWDLVQKGL
jgi:aminoglycoside phosphotransferase (APT) family kinase protein